MNTNTSTQGKKMKKLKVAAVPEHFPHFNPEDFIEPKNRSLWLSKLVVGSQWRLLENVFPISALVWQKRFSPKKNIIEHDLRYLWIQRYEEDGRGIGAQFEVGSIVTYAGTVQVTEVSYGDKDASVLRHTFLVNGNRYMVTNLNIVEPVI